MISTLNRYVSSRILKGIATAFLVVTGIIMLVDFVEGTRNIADEGDISSMQILYLTLLKTPKLVEQTIPFVVLFGVMGALHGMNRRSELIVMRASGLSAWKFLRPALWIATILGIGWAALFNPLASKLASTYDVQREAWTSTQSKADLTDIWLRDGTDVSQTVIHAENMDLRSKRLEQPVFYQLDLLPNGSTVFARRFDAQSARLVTQGYWQLDEVIENAPGELTQRHSSISLPTQITREDLQNQAKEKSNPPFWNIPATIAENERAGFSALSLRMQFNKLLALPVMLIAMTFIAASVSMQQIRGGGTLRLLMLGASLGFIVYFADSVVSAFGEVSTLPVMLASWSIPIFVLLAGMSYLSKIEDG
jgi:lipopolysaccharide export system permease protein